MRNLVIILFLIALISNEATSDWKKVFVYSWKPSFVASDISCSDSLNCMVVGGSWTDGTICLKSTDGGYTWFVQYADTLKYIYDEHGKLKGKEKPKFSSMKRLAFVTPSLIVGGHEDGSITVSYDGGETFEFLGEKLEYSVFEIKFLDSLYGVAIGPTNVVRTSDGGITWENLTKNLDTSKGKIEPLALFLQNDNIFCGGITFTDGKNISSFFKSTDRGQTWKNYLNINDAENFYISNVFFHDAEQGWLIGNYRRIINDSLYRTHTILHTTDGGLSWIPQLDTITPYVQNSPNGVFFEKSDVGIVYGNSKAVWRTSNGGQLWELDRSKCDYSAGMFWRMAFPHGDLSHIIAPMTSTEIYLYDENLSSAEPTPINMEISPNPASDFVSLSGFAHGERIEIYSQLGVKVLETNRVKERIDVSALPAGVYFLKAGGRVGKFLKI